MRRIGYLFEKICDLENIREAIRNAYKHKKRRRGAVKRVYDNIDYYAVEIRDMLIRGEYSFSAPLECVYHDYNKDRLLRVPRFYPDQIIMWAALLVVEPILNRGQYKHSFSGIKGRGQMTAKKYIERCEKKCFKKKAHFAKTDIRKYYDHVNTVRLKRLFRRVIKDERTLILLDSIVDCGGKNLPIGFPTSPLFGNFYLQSCDHYVKEDLKIRFYARFADDMIFIDFNRRELKKKLLKINLFLHGVGCCFKKNMLFGRLFEYPISFVGYMFYKGYTLLRKRIFINLNRTVKRIKRFGLTVKKAMRFLSLISWTKRINFRKYYVERIKPIVSKRQARKIISVAAKASEREITCRKDLIMAT